MTTYYVETTGDDGNDGLSVGQAFATIQKGISVLTPSDDLKVGAGKFYEEPTWNGVNGTSGQPIKAAGTRGQNGEWLTTIEAGFLVQSAWVAAPEVGPGVFKTPFANFEPVWATANGKMLPLITSTNMAKQDGSENDGFVRLANPRNHEESVSGFAGTSKQWDVTEAMIGWLNDTLYCRFRDNRDPGTVTIRVQQAPASPDASLAPVMGLRDNTYIEVSDFHICGGKTGWLGIQTLLEGCTLRDCRITACEMGAVLSSDNGDNRITNNLIEWDKFLTGDGGPVFSPGSAWLGTSQTNIDRGNAYEHHKFLFADGESNVRAIELSNTNSNDVVSGNVCDGGPLGIVIRLGQAGDVEIYNNKIRNMHSVGISIVDDVINTQIHHNDIDNCSSGIRLQGFGLDTITRTARIHDNRIANQDDSGYGLLFNVQDSGGPNPDITIEYNRFSGHAITWNLNNLGGTGLGASVTLDNNIVSPARTNISPQNIMSDVGGIQSCEGNWLGGTFLPSWPAVWAGVNDENPGQQYWPITSLAEELGRNMAILDFASGTSITVNNATFLNHSPTGNWTLEYEVYRPTSASTTFAKVWESDGASETHATGTNIFRINRGTGGNQTFIAATPLDRYFTCREYFDGVQPRIWHRATGESLGNKFTNTNTLGDETIFYIGGQLSNWVGHIRNVKVYTGDFRNGTEQLIHFWPIDENVADGGTIRDHVGGLDGTLALGSGQWINPTVTSIGSGGEYATLSAFRSAWNAGTAIGQAGEHVHAEFTGDFTQSGAQTFINTQAAELVFKPQGGGRTTINRDGADAGVFNLQNVARTTLQDLTFEFTGDKSSGVVQPVQLAGANPVNVFLNRLEFRAVNQVRIHPIDLGSTGAGDVTVNSCQLYGATSTGSDADFRNRAAGIYAGTGTYLLYVNGCTFDEIDQTNADNMPAYGIFASGTPTVDLFVRNSAFTRINSVGGAESSWSGMNSTVEVTTATFDNLGSVAGIDETVYVNAINRDYTPIANGALDDAGTDIGGGDVAIDFAGFDRTSNDTRGPWDIGSIEATKGTDPPVSWTVFVPANLRICWHDGQGNLKPSCTTSQYSGGDPASPQDLKPSIVHYDTGFLKKGLTIGGDLKPSMKPAKTQP